MKMMIELSKDELNALQYPVVVEMWDKVMGSASKKRKYREQFTETERDKIRVYYNMFYRWYLKSGTPDKATMSPDTYQLLQRACNFFGTI